MSRVKHRLVPILTALAVGGVVAACGAEEEILPEQASSSTVAPAPSPNESAPVVAGPRPASPAPDSSTASEGATDGAGSETDCGLTSGPDGALRILITGGDVDCEAATELADEYSPLIATGRPQTIGGWECGPSPIPGALAVCTGADDAEITFSP